jgi:hypothetical protein
MAAGSQGNVMTSSEAPLLHEPSEKSQLTTRKDNAVRQQELPASCHHHPSAKVWNVTTGARAEQRGL